MNGSTSGAFSQRYKRPLAAEAVKLVMSLVQLTDTIQEEVGR